LYPGRSKVTNSQALSKNIVVQAIVFDVACIPIVVQAIVFDVACIPIVVQAIVFDVACIPIVVQAIVFDVACIPIVVQAIVFDHCCPAKLFSSGIRIFESGGYGDSSWERFEIP
jgi:hypothetical protein